MESIKNLVGKHEVIPKQLIFSHQNNRLRFTVKNTSLKSTTFEINTPVINHYKLQSQRTFTLAPGMTKICVLRHDETKDCTDKPCSIKVASSEKQSSIINVYCNEPQLKEEKLISYPKSIQLGEVYEFKKAQYLIYNLSEDSLKINLRVNDNGNSQKNNLELEMPRSEYILLKDKKVQVDVDIYFKESGQFKINLLMTVSKQFQEGKEYNYQLEINGNSFQKNQFIGDDKGSKLDSLSAQIINGTSYKSSFYIYNHYHKQVSFNIVPHIRSNNPGQFACKWKQHQIFFTPQTPFVRQFSRCRVDYQIQTNPNEHDTNFTLKYSNIQIDDDICAYKTRASPFFTKNADIEIQVVFDDQTTQKVLHKCSIINCAVRVEQKLNSIILQNDSGLSIPYSIEPNVYYKITPTKGILQTNESTQLLLTWKNSNKRSKIKIQLPQIDIVLVAKSGENLQRETVSLAKSFYKQTFSINRPGSSIDRQRPSVKCRPISALKPFPRPQSAIRPQTIIRPISAISQIPIRKPKIISKQDYMKCQPKYKHFETLTNEQMENLQVSFSNGANILTNSHPHKSILLHFQERGYLALPSCQSYEIRDSFETLSFTVNKQSFSLQKCPIKDNDSDKDFQVNPKQLVFNFMQNQKDKEFEIIKTITIINKKEKPINVCCLTADNMYFKSKQPDNRICVPALGTVEYRVVFCPENTCVTKETKITQNMQFSVENQVQSVYLVGELLEVECDCFPKSVKFENSHLGEEQTSSILFLSNSSYGKLVFQFQEHEIVRVEPRSGSVPQKSKLKCEVFFNPSKHLRAYQSFLKLYLRGSHIIQIPLFINTLQPSIRIEEEHLNFGVGILNQELFSQLTINNKDNSFCQVAIDFTATPLILKDGFLLGNQKLTVSLQPKSKVTVDVKILACQEGKNCIKLNRPLAELVGYGPIPSPYSIEYIGKQTLLLISPSEQVHNINLSEINQSYKLRLLNLADHPLNVRTELKHVNICKFLIVSCSPSHSEVLPGQTIEVILSFIVVDLQKVKQKASDSSLIIYINDQKYTQLALQITMPIPSLQLSPSEIILPTVSHNTWSNSKFKIINKGYREIFVKVIKPSSINFELECNLPVNKLTRLNNEIDVPVMFRCKKNISFQVNIEVVDNFGNKQTLKVAGTATDSPFFLVPKQTLPQSSKSFSTISSLVQIPPQQMNDDIQFINKWLTSRFPVIKSQYKQFNLWIKNVNNLKLFLLEFGINLNSYSKSIEMVLEELKVLGIHLNSVVVENLEKGEVNDWMQFLWHFLSFKFVSPDTPKWLQNLCSIHFDSYDLLLVSHKKVMIDIWNRLMQGILISRIKQWSGICQKVHPYLNIFNDINSRRQLIILLNQLYHKLSEPVRQKIQTDTLNHTITVQNLSSKTHLNYWVLTGKDCQLREEDRKFELFSGESMEIKVSIKSNCEIIIFNDSIFEPMHIYEMHIFEHAPVVNQVTIECEDKCTQEWKLDYVCPIESSYRVDFTGDAQFRVKAPPLGMMKQASIIPIRVIYSPTNLRNHTSKLTVANKYSKQIYEIKGIPLCSSLVEYEKKINPIQETLYKESVLFLWDLPQQNTANQSVKSKGPRYQVIEYNGHHDEFLLAEIETSKVNRRQLRIHFQFKFTKVYRNLVLLYQVISDDHTSKIIRFEVNVTPKPVAIQGCINCEIGKSVKEKIPINNSLKVKQMVKVQLLNKLQKSEFKLNRIGIVRVEPGEVQYLTLIYKPQSFNPCTIKFNLTHQQSCKVYTYTFTGTPQFPTIYPTPLQILCEVQQTQKCSVNIQNALRQKVTYEVQTNLQQITGKDTLLVKPLDSAVYQFKVLSLHPGTQRGELVFYHQKFKVVYEVTLITENRKHRKKLRVFGQIRKTSIVMIQLENKSEKDIVYHVLWDSCYLDTERVFQIPKKSVKVLEITYLPLFQGTESTELKFFNVNQPQIVYQIQMKSTPHYQVLPQIQCQLGMPATTKLTLKNPTKTECTVSFNNLPAQLQVQLNHIQIPPKKSITLEVTFKPIRLLTSYQHLLTFTTNNIGNYQFKLSYLVNLEKVMDIVNVHMSSSKEKFVDHELVFQNRFENVLNCTVSDNLDGKTIYSETGFKVPSFGQKVIRFRICTETITTSTSQITIKDKESECQWIYPIKMIHLIEHDELVDIKGYAQVTSKFRIKNLHMKNVQRVVANGLPIEFFNVTQQSLGSFILEVLVNKLCKYKGHITFYNDNKAEKYPLRIQIQEPKVETLVLCSNIGEKGSMQLDLKNGSGKFKVQLVNNKNQEFSVEPMKGNFDTNSQVRVNVNYCPKDYSGVKKAKVVIITQTNVNYFQLIGKFRK